MTRTQKLSIPRDGLSLQFVTADALNVDWSEGYRVVLPRPTYGDVRERDSSVIEEWESADERGDSEAVQFGDAGELDEHHLEEFQQTTAYDEWRDGFEPVMNYAWPVSLSYGGPSAEEAAQRIEQFACNCSLVEFGDGRNPFGEGSDAPEYAIALTGGGMDLSDHIAAAYLCCGCVPPERILSGLLGAISDRRAAQLPLAEAYLRAANYFRSRADRLTEVGARIVKESADA